MYGQESYVIYISPVFQGLSVKIYNVYVEFDPNKDQIK